LQLKQVEPGLRTGFPTHIRSIRPEAGFHHSVRPFRLHSRHSTAWSRPRPGFSVLAGWNWPARHRFGL